MTKEQFKEKLLAEGWKQDGNYPNRMVKDSNLRCALHRRGYNMERFSQAMENWVPFKTQQYSKVKS